MSGDDRGLPFGGGGLGRSARFHPEAALPVRWKPAVRTELADAEGRAGPKGHIASVRDSDQKRQDSDSWQ